MKARREAPAAASAPAKRSHRGGADEGTRLAGGSRHRHAASMSKHDGAHRTAAAHGAPGRRAGKAKRASSSAVHGRSGAGGRDDDNDDDDDDDASSSDDGAGGLYATGSLLPRGGAKSGEVLGDFEVVNLRPEHAISARRLLSTWLGSITFNAAELTSLLCSDDYVGCGVTSGDDDVIAIASVFSLLRQKSKECCKQLVQFLRQSGSSSFTAQLDSLLARKDANVGVLVLPRFTNSPFELVAPLLSTLVNDLRDASQPGEDAPDVYRYTHLVLLARKLVPRNAAGEAQRGEYMFPDEELLSMKALVSCMAKKSVALEDAEKQAYDVFFELCIVPADVLSSSRTLRAIATATGGELVAE